MSAIAEKNPNVRFEIFTTVPEWFFTESLPPIFRCHAIEADVGLVQSAPMRQDLSQTLSRLESFLNRIPGQLPDLSQQLVALKCCAVISDISPLGIQAAKSTGIPSILIENFTWDWLYEIYRQEYPRFDPLIAQLESIYRHVDVHIQTEPLCRSSNRALLTAPPASRKPRTSPESIRADLGIDPDVNMVLVTMGGIPERFKNTGSLSLPPKAALVIPGGSNHYEQHGAIRLIPHHSRFFHPDLIRASDVVVGKAGYSTIAEVYCLGKPFGYLTRPDFRESDQLVRFIQREMVGVEISSTEFEYGTWTMMIDELLERGKIARPNENGAPRIADQVLQTMSSV